MMSKKRLTKYDTHVKDRFIEIEGWARDGLIDKQIAKNLGVAYSTFRKYVKEYSALSATLKRGKEVIDREVENALLKRALGYEYEEVKRKVSDDGTEVTTTIKQVVPDTTAQIFWLKNRKPEKWRDKRDIEHSGDIKVNKLDSILEQLKE